MSASKNVQQAIDDIRRGRMVVLVDDYDRENEGDIVFATELASPEVIRFTINYAKGLMCVPTDGAILDRLEIPSMVQVNTDNNETPFTVSVDGHPKFGVTTGMSVEDRLTTLHLLSSPGTIPDDLTRPGHLFPLRPKPGLLNDRRGHTEGSVVLMNLAGLKPSAVICEIMNDDCSMCKGGELNQYAIKHGLTLVSIEELANATGD